MFGLFKKRIRVDQLEGVDAVAHFLRYDLAFKITKAGTTVADMQLKSGYSPVEVASNLALVAMASKVKTAGSDIEELLRLPIHAMEMVKRLKLHVEQGLMRPELYKNDVTALIGLTQIDAETENWVEKVLADNPLDGEPLAISAV